MNSILFHSYINVFKEDNGIVFQQLSKIVKQQKKMKLSISKLFKCLEMF